MKSGIHTFEALLLRVVDYGDRDRIVTFIGKGVGKATAFARGARASRKRFPGGLELFTRYSLTVKKRNEGMGNLQSAEPVAHLRAMSNGLERVAVASCGLELVRELVHEGESQDVMLEGLWYFLEQLQGLGDDMPRLLLALRWFELQMLSTQGQAPELVACLRCHESVQPDDELRFSSRAGGVLHARCERPEDKAVNINPELVGGLRRLLTRPLTEVLEGSRSRSSGDDGERRLTRFAMLTGRLLRRQLEDATSSSLKTYAFLDSLPG